MCFLPLLKNAEKCILSGSLSRQSVVFAAFKSVLGDFRHLCQEISMSEPEPVQIRSNSFENVRLIFLRIFCTSLTFISGRVYRPARLMGPRPSLIKVVNEHDDHDDDERRKMINVYD